MQEKILVVEDEREIADLIELYLLNENYSVFKAHTAAEALALADEQRPDLAVLDVMLPDGDGFELCRNIRARHNFPVIMLTAKESESDKITGLTLGADDYMTKPFRPLELAARVKAQLRRYKKYNQQPDEPGDVIAHRDIILNAKTHECLQNDRPLELTPTEFAILRILMERSGEVVSAEELFHAIWKDEYYSKSNNTITVHIRHLREKLGDCAENAKYIKTVWGVGYKIEK